MKTGLDGLGQDALLVFDVDESLELCERVLVRIVRGGLRDRGWRHLLAVADHDDCLGPSDGTDRVGNANLGRLVEDDEVEGQRSDREEPRHRVRADQYTGHQLRDQVAELVEERTYFHTPASTLEFPAKGTHLTSIALG